MNINLAQLGKAIRQIRELREYTQAELGEQSGLKGNTIALIERGKRGVSLDALNALADALEVPAACLTMLGTPAIRGDSSDVGLVKSMQELILSTVLAQSRIELQEKVRRKSPERAKASAARRRRPAVAQKHAKTTSRSKSRRATSKRRKTLEPA